MSGLSDRIRGIVRAGRPGAQRDSPQAGRVLEDPPSVLSDPPSATARTLEETLGGEWRDGCFVVERRLAPETRHGNGAIGDLADTLRLVSDEASLVAPGASPRAPFVFFDLETTGLSGGAGTYAFLVGIARFCPDGSLAIAQHLLARFADERPLLARIGGSLADAGALVSFNGKSFDAPLLETRFLFHRLEWVGGALPHIDVLHPARRFWKAPAAAVQSDDGSSCSLAVLERQVLGARRRGDVQGFEIPARYFQFVRSGDARSLAAVLEHNRLDLVSLAGLTARLLHLVRAGETATRDRREALALGHVYARARRDAAARAAFTRALALCASPAGTFDPVRVEALRALALLARRARRHEESAGYWRSLLDVPGCPLRVEHEAAEALAIHHEHRLRDLSLAKAFALRTLEMDASPAWTHATRYRLARLDRKMKVGSIF